MPNWAPGAKALSDDGRVSEVLKGIRVFLVPGVPGHRVRPRWRDDVHAAIERAVAFLLCVHCERRLAFDNCFAYHGRRSSWVDSSGSGPGVRPKGRGWPRHIFGETRAEPIRLCRKRPFTTLPRGITVQRAPIQGARTFSPCSYLEQLAGRSTPPRARSSQKARRGRSRSCKWGIRAHTAETGAARGSATGPVSVPDRAPPGPGCRRAIRLGQGRRRSR